jgi:hypothetical protein
MKWKDAVLEYAAKCSLEISEHYALFPEGEDLGIGAAWPQQYPNSERRGVYLILSKAELPLYIGKSAHALLDCHSRGPR